jgi:hypothetical protein
MFLFMYEAGVEPSPLLPGPFIGPLHQPWMIVMIVEQLEE